VKFFVFSINTRAYGIPHSSTLSVISILHKNIYFNKVKFQNFGPY